MACCEEELSTPLLPEEPPRGAVLTKILRSLRSISNCEDVNASQSSPPYTLIQKVPNILRCNKDLNKYLEPMVVSIGPHHYNKVKLQPGEKLKHKLMEKFFHSRDRSVLYQKILNNIKGLRKCYDEDATENYDDKTLAWMLLVDGSSVLYFIHCYATDQYSVYRDLKIKHHEVVFMHRDLFLLENQLPFGVLKELMCSEIESELWKREIEAFIRMDIESPRRLQETRIIGLKDTPDEANNQKPLLTEDPPHLLDLLREGLIRKPDQSNNPGTQATMNRTSHTVDISGGPVLPQDRKAWFCGLCCQPTRPRGKSIKKTEDGRSFRNITELKAVGIHLKASDTNYVTDVSFESSSCFNFYAYLKLPRIIVDNSTIAKFLNLAAYEMSPGYVNGLEVTSYICFLESLIDHPDDVKELREDQVVFNFLGSDKEVAKLFNMISNDLLPDPEMYKSVEESIQEHFLCRCNTWMAKGLHDHCSSPWTMIAFFAATFVIILTFLQTFYTMFPQS